ncbi:protein of unknown function [Magnetospirillum sp. XM-1]|nr:protein of unknown function [Magnetospirillum sp. XM-1]
MPILPLALPSSKPAATPPITAPMAAPPTLQSLSKAVSMVLQPVKTTGTQIAEARRDIRPSLDAPKLIMISPEQEASCGNYPLPNRGRQANQDDRL